MKESFLTKDPVRKIESKIIFNLLGKGIDVAGVENIPPRGTPFIVALGPHTGWLEVLPALFLMDQIPATMTKDSTLRKPVLGSLAKAFGCYPVERGEPDSVAYEYSYDVLVSGEPLLILPEGTRGRTSLGNREEFKKAKTGIVRIAKEASRRMGGKPVSILPMGVWGTERVFPEIEEHVSLKEKLVFQRQRIQVRFGPVIDIIYHEGDNLTDRSEEIQNLIQQVMLGIRNLIPEKYHGFYKEELMRARNKAKQFGVIQELTD